ncbi:thioredoxin domain-containing protein 6 isoform X2 [Sus scrofa]|uniref:thioredoxin domain-containing protein 6 isoform X2 n=1 Tax=Sus scrofa TaxID=9823 RepID=UPI000A2B5EBF|nr:thioredoxin domain-containing protein 6 isoform X2 [Sus scrofa]
MDIIVDVYQGWCGPCKPVVSLFQKMRIEAGLDLLHFALAEADCLDVLEKYRGRCEPTFLFYAVSTPSVWNYLMAAHESAGRLSLALILTRSHPEASLIQGGELVAVVRGANAPLLQKTIRDQLEAEKRVLAEGGERRVIKDEALSDENDCFSHGKDDGDNEDVVSSEKACTLAIIKPDAVVHGKTDEIIMKIQEAGFDLLANEERTMTEAEMRLFYQHRAGEEAFEKLVHHMCSGPSHLLILTRTEGAEDVVTAWQNLMGPCDPDVARREQPDSQRVRWCGRRATCNTCPGNTDSRAPPRPANSETLVSALSMAQQCPLTPSTEAGIRKTPAGNWHCSSPVLSFQTRFQNPLWGERLRSGGPCEALCFPEDVDEVAVLLCGNP